LEAQPEAPKTHTDELAADGSPLERYVPLASWLLVILTLLFVALKIVGTGYLPERGQG
jgi:hypothetical protein